MSAREAARSMGLSRSVIDRRVSGKVGLHAGVGPAPVMTSAMEDIILQHMNDRVERGDMKYMPQIFISLGVTHCLPIGFGHDGGGLRKLAAHQAAVMGITDFKASSGWVAKFKARNEMSLRAASSYDRARGAASNPVLLQSFFDLLGGNYSFTVHGLAYVHLTLIVY